MDEPTLPPTHNAAIRTAPTRRNSHALLVLLVALAATGLPGGAPSAAEPVAACCSTDGRPALPTDRDPATVDASPDTDRGRRESEPDRVADFTGGIAARLHSSLGAPIVGEVFLLMASGGSTANARLYDRTPYTHDYGVHPDTTASNLIAAETVSTITGTDVEHLEFTGAPGGGLSGGVTYAVAYLDVLSDGAFTGDLRVAASGRLLPAGHLTAIDNIDAKIAAANLASVDVMFTSSVPSSEVIDTHGARFVGEAVRDPSTGATLNGDRRLRTFRLWGANRPDGMDIVDARHLIDVASYLCGTGSSHACQITDRLDDQAQQRLDQLPRSSPGAGNPDRDPPLAAQARRADQATG